MAHQGLTKALCLLAGILAGLFCMVAQGATLQISPVMVDFQAGTNATGITLKNPGDTPLYGQVRVFRWEQANGEDVLTPTQDLVASPPLIQLGPHAEQLVRLVRTAHEPVAGEQSYRVLIDELPQPDAGTISGVMIRLRYSVPVFIEAANGLAQPQLAWYLKRNAKGWVLRVSNTGSRRAQVASVQLVNEAGGVVGLNNGLLGYALAGRERSWQLALPVAADLHGHVKVRAVVNSIKTETAVTVE